MLRRRPHLPGHQSRGLHHMAQYPGLNPGKCRSEYRDGGKYFAANKNPGISAGAILPWVHELELNLYIRQRSVLLLASLHARYILQP